LARQLFDIGIFNALSSAGALGAGWKLAFYTATTTTPITTYNAASGGVANANPVVADVNGRFPEIYIEVDQSIKYVLLDASNVVKVTRDNYSIAAEVVTVADDLDDFLAGTDPLPVAYGGTGSETAPDALTALGALPKAGGTVTGNIVRNAKGAYLYFETAAMVNPTVFLTASGDPDPRTPTAGQVWLKY
jgi:hypothetical protein